MKRRRGREGKGGRKKTWYIRKGDERRQVESGNEPKQMMIWKGRK